MLVSRVVITVHTSVQLQHQEDLNVPVEMAITSGMMDGDVEVCIYVKDSALLSLGDILGTGWVWLSSWLCMNLTQTLLSLCMIKIL